MIFRLCLSLLRKIRTIYSKCIVGSCGQNTVFDVGVKLYGTSCIKIGSFCVVNSGVIIQSCCGAPVIIGDNVTLSYRCMLLTGGLNISSIKTSRSHEVEGISLRNNVWVGANAIILPGITLHEGAIVAAGSVVTKDVARNTIVAGNPARVIREYKG